MPKTGFVRACYSRSALSPRPELAGERGGWAVGDGGSEVVAGDEADQRQRRPTFPADRDDAEVQAQLVLLPEGRGRGGRRRRGGRGGNSHTGGGGPTGGPWAATRGRPSGARARASSHGRMTTSGAGRVRGGRKAGK